MQMNALVSTFTHTDLASGIFVLLTEINEVQLSKFVNISKQFNLRFVSNWNEMRFLQRNGGNERVVSTLSLLKTVMQC